MLQQFKKVFRLGPRLTWSHHYHHHSYIPEAVVSAIHEGWSCASR